MVRYRLTPLAFQRSVTQRATATAVDKFLKIFLGFLQIFVDPLHLVGIVAGGEVVVLVGGRLRTVWQSGIPSTRQYLECVVGLR